MAGLLNVRAYLIIGVFTSALCALVIYFDTGGATAGFFENLASNARPFLGAGITNVIYTPLINVFSDYYWAIAAGIAWPLMIIWLFLMLFGLGATIIGPTMSEVGNIG